MTYHTPESARRCRSLCLFAILLTLLLTACSSMTEYDPGADRNLPMKLGRIQSMEQYGVSVEVSIPTDDNASRYFGVPLARYGIQPIWIQIVNRGDIDYWLLPNAIDPDYYSADEAALLSGEDLPADKLDEHTRLFRKQALPFYSAAGSTIEGYVYATHERGGRLVEVRMKGRSHSIRMRFAVLLPTEGFDYEYSELRERYAQLDELPDLDIEQTRTRLRDLPCCTTTADGTGSGDPLNIVLIGSGENIVAALNTSGWDFTEAISIDSIRRMIGAAVEGNAFPMAPISSLYAFGRKQDIAFQRSRSTIHRRNHMRLWLAPFLSEGKAVWIGQVSRDIGVKITDKSPTLTTHIIDPVVDESREYLLDSLMHTDTVARFAFVKGVGESSHDSPSLNLTDDPYFTDGLRLVIWVSREPVPPEASIDLDWNDSVDPVLKGTAESPPVPAAPEL
jgi:hypothetical protein